MSNIQKNQQYIDIWCKVVDTQMHFNEMQVKSRQLGLTFVAAALGVAIVLLSNGDDFAFDVPIGRYEFKLHVSVVLVLGAWLALEAVKQLDLNVYHRMLRGAVTFGMDFEENYLKEIFDLEKGMTQSITHFSQYQDASYIKSEEGKYSYQGKCKITAYDKILKFYQNTRNFLWIAAGLLLVFTNASPINSYIHRDQVASPAVSEIVAPEDTTKPNEE